MFKMIYVTNSLKLQLIFQKFLVLCLA